jgi:Zn-dependent protease with chaperone function
MVTPPTSAPPPSFVARRFDAIGALAHVGQATVDGGEIVFEEPQSPTIIRRSLDDAVVSEPLLHAPRQFRWADGSAMHVEESAQLAAALAAAGVRTSIVVRCQRAWPASLLALVLLVAASMWLYVVGLPLGAEWLADRLPPELEERMGEQMLAALDKGALAPSTLSRSRRTALLEDFTDFQKNAGLTSVRRIVFRSAKSGRGINAFALPGGTVVFLDGLVAFSANDQEMLLGVLAHEAGHERQHHMTRGLFRGLGGVVLAGLLWGDYSNVATSTAVLFGQLHYSRKDEQAADDFAIDALRRAQISPAAATELIRQLSAETTKGGRVELPGWLSTHPPDWERIQRALQAARADTDRERFARPLPDLSPSTPSR